MILPMGRAEILKRDLHLIIDDSDYTKLLYRASQYPLMKSLLERLAPEECITEEHDYFSHSISCVFCRAPFIDELKGIVHEAACPWVEARRLLEELK